MFLGLEMEPLGLICAAGHMMEVIINDFLSAV